MSRTRDSWDRLCTAVKRRDVVLIVGAGVSYGSGLPTWEELMRRLAARLGLADALRLRTELARSWPAVASVMRSTHERLDGKREWFNLLRECLYEPGTWAEQRKSQLRECERLKRKNEAFAKELAENNPTLASIVAMCAQWNGIEWVRHPRVAALLTYNLDGLIQIYDRCRHGSPRIFRTVERASKAPERGKIPLYHLHGYLLPLPGNPRDEAADSLVFCEDEYQARTDQPYSFAMTTAMWALREFTGIFIGCSMTDELMRRALYRSKRELDQAIEAEKRTLPRNAPRRHFAILERNAGAGVDALVEEDLALLGAQPLWINSFGEIPKRLCKLREWLDAS